MYYRATWSCSLSLIGHPYVIINTRLIPTGQVYNNSIIIKMSFWIQTGYNETKNGELIVLSHYGFEGGFFDRFLTPKSESSSSTNPIFVSIRSRFGHDKANSRVDIVICTKHGIFQSAFVHVVLLRFNAGHSNHMIINERHPLCSFQVRWLFV